MPLTPFPPDCGTLEDVKRGFHLPPAGVRPHTILDLGANVGLTCLDFCEKFPDAQIIGVELDGDNVAVARQNLADHPNVSILHAGIALIDGHCVYNKSAWANAYQIGTGDREAPAITIDTVLANHFPDGVDFMKIDIEGMEREVFQKSGDAAWPELVRCLSVETHYGYEPREAVHDLSALGYPAVWIHNYGVPGPGMQEHWVVFAQR